MLNTDTRAQEHVFVYCFESQRAIIYFKRALGRALYANNINSVMEIITL